MYEYTVRGIMLITGRVLSRQYRHHLSCYRLMSSICYSHLCSPVITAPSSVYSSNWADLDPVQAGPLCPRGARGIICLYEVFSYWAVITITDLVITLMT